MRGTRTAVALVAVGAVLADSSVVTLGLPDVLREFDAEVSEVAWVLTAYNLVLALAVVPVALLLRRVGAGVAWRVGVLVFGGASLACALAPGLEALVAARCVQALGGAAIALTALALAREGLGERRGAALWGAAGIVGAAVGPAAGGALTELLSWQAIFAAQVPLAAAVFIAPRGSPARPVEEESAAPAASGRDRAAAGASLALLSAGLTGALFLLVILLIEGWRHSPAEAAAIVSVMAVATLGAVPLVRRIGPGAPAATAGVIAAAGGLAALGLLPGATWAYTVAPQLLLGLGLGIGLGVLTSAALDAAHGATTGAAAALAARHAGVVLGLLLLTPVFSDDLVDEQRNAELAGTALLLDAPLQARLKIDLGEDLARRISEADGRLPVLDPVFEDREAPPEAAPGLQALQNGLNEELDKAATHAFSRSFLLAALLCGLALVPAVALRRTA